jgi:Rod binding domain-containing protein
VTSIKLNPIAQRPVDHGVNPKSIPLTQQPEEVAKQFEGMLLKQMIDSMWSTVPKNGLLSGSHEEDMYRDMLNEALATSISEGKGIGVKDIILKDINKVSKKL